MHWKHECLLVKEGCRLSPTHHSSRTFQQALEFGVLENVNTHAKWTEATAGELGHWSEKLQVPVEAEFLKAGDCGDGPRCWGIWDHIFR